MNKIFRYELKRLLWNKFFIALLIINGLYAWYLLSTDIIAGVAYTAPFSPWSFGAYVAKTMPISILTLLFFLTFYHSKKEKQVEVLTTATPVNPIHYTLVRCSTVAICFLIINVLVIGLSVYFYISYFDYRNFTLFIIPALMILLPCFVFAIGLGNLAGRIHLGVLYALMPITLIIGFAGINSPLDFFGAGYFSNYPISLPLGADGEPAFIVGTGFLIARMMYLMIGMILLLISIRTYKRKAQKA